jgi:xylan 1,4-beta-xylosidase
VLLIIVNHNVPGEPIDNETVCLVVDGVNAPSLIDPRVRRIDESHANPMQAWIQMGSPQYLTQNEIDVLMKASEMPFEEIEYSVSGSKQITFSFVVPPEGVVAISWKIL